MDYFGIFGNFRTSRILKALEECFVFFLQFVGMINALRIHHGQNIDSTFDLLDSLSYYLSVWAHPVFRSEGSW